VIRTVVKVCPVPGCPRSTTSLTRAYCRKHGRRLRGRRELVEKIAASADPAPAVTSAS
jgi:hypothetical protein